jgi:transcriptional regulator
VAKKSDVLRGTLDLMILRSLELAPLHGSGLAQRLVQVTGGALDVGPGSIFPALYRLEHKGLVKGRWGETESGRRARFYALTAAGRKRLGVEKESWEKMVLAIGRVLA